MINEYNRNLTQAIFHGVVHSIHTSGDFTFRIYSVFKKNLDEGDIANVPRLKRRLLNEIVQRNNARVSHYPYCGADQIFDTNPFSLYTFYSTKDDDHVRSGLYSLFPLEFICKKCGKIYVADKTTSLGNIPNICGCGGCLEQNTIVLFCENCGKISYSMNCFCKVPGHGSNDVYLIRGKKDELTSWNTYCKSCRDAGRESVNVFRIPCSCGGARRPLTVRDGGIYTPVVLTLIDLEGSPSGEYSDHIRIAVENNIITQEGLRSLLPSAMPVCSDLMTAIDQVQNGFDNPMTSVFFEKANQYILDAINSVKKEFYDIDLDEWNDAHSIIKVSSSFEDYLRSLSGSVFEEYMSWYNETKMFYGISEIRYAEKIKLILATIGQISGTNKFYEDNFVPHFIPFKSNKESNELYSMVVPIETEGILFRLDPVKVCYWLFINGVIDNKYDDLSSAKLFLSRMRVNSNEYVHVKTLIHTFSHILIKQSSVYTGLDENTCSELLFTTDASFLIYSTSSVNIGGFEYAFNYSLRNWFSRILDAAEDCTFDPTCTSEGGKCFSCLYVMEFVCCNFNKDLSRQSLIGGGDYDYGFWKMPIHFPGDV